MPRRKDHRYCSSRCRSSRFDRENPRNNVTEDRLLIKMSDRNRVVLLRGDSVIDVGADPRTADE